MKTKQTDNDLTPALSFGLPLLFVPLMVVAWYFGGWTILLVPLFGYLIITIFDFIFGEKLNIPDPINGNFLRYKIVLWIWPIVQLFLIYGSLFVIFNFSDWSIFEKLGLMLVQGMITGAVGITFAHELMHQNSKKERFLADCLMGMAIYGHFRTEHLLVHHRYVGTTRDAVTARYNESFYQFFVRIIPSCLFSAWSVEVSRLSQKGKHFFDKSNPFWVYLLFPFVFTLGAFLIGGTSGIVLFLVQASVAVIHLEVVNYIEHYGLKRQTLANGKIEPTRPHHSWNANHGASNLLLINLQKHSDHHVKPNKPYPVIQSYEAQEAPQLPFGYPLMVILSLIPILWRRVMNPRVLNWRKKFYPDISAWEKFEK